MKIAVTGAAGFLGSATVLSALAAGASVVALVRPARANQTFAWSAHPQASTRAVELGPSPALVEALRDVDVLVHAAAAKAGSYEQQFQDTVVTTEHLLAAMRAAGVRRLVGISSFSVYDYNRPAAGSLLDENSPVFSDPDTQGPYARVKLLQENQFRAFGKGGGEVCILRPGIIFGADNLSHSAFGRWLGSGIFLRMGPPAAELPLTYIDNCADAVVAAALTPSAAGTLVDIVDDALPARSRFVTELTRLSGRPVHSIPVPMWVLELAAGAFAGARALASLLGKKLRGPVLLTPDGQNVYFKPLRYSNALAKAALAWTPRISIDEALARLRK